MDNLTSLDLLKLSNLGEGEVISNPKIYVADFGLLCWAFFGRFPKKKLQYCFPEMREEESIFRKFILIGSPTRPLQCNGVGLRSKFYVGESLIK